MVMRPISVTFRDSSSVCADASILFFINALFPIDRIKRDKKNKK